MENSQCSNTRDGDSIKDVITRAVREPSRRTALSLKAMERLYMEAQDGLKTIAPPLFLNIFFYFLLV